MKNHSSINGFLCNHMYSMIFIILCIYISFGSRLACTLMETLPMLDLWVSLTHWMHAPGCKTMSHCSTMQKFSDGLSLTLGMKYSCICRVDIARKHILIFSVIRKCCFHYKHCVAECKHSQMQDVCCCNFGNVNITSALNY